MKNENKKIKIEIEANELFTIVEMLENYLDSELYAYAELNDEYESITSKLIKIYNENK